jgi:hypothetical protein
MAIRGGDARPARSEYLLIAPCSIGARIRVAPPRSFPGKKRGKTMRRVPKILRPRARPPEPRPTELSGFPVSFTVRSSGSVAKFIRVQVPRSQLGRLLAEARALDLHALSAIGLHGLSRLDKAMTKRVVSDLQVIAEQSEDEDVRHWARHLLTIKEQPQLMATAELFIDAGA